MKDEPVDIKPKDKLPLPSKRPSKKKPKDKPKRPLSAYNFFFKEEREKILKVVLADDDTKVEQDTESEDYLDTEAVSKLRKEGGKVSFEEMGKLIGQRWKNIEPDRLTKFSEMAAEDTERYKREMTEYNSRQELKMRNEALKPAASTFSRSDKGGMDPSRGGYDMNSFAGSQMGGGYPYGGMEFGGAYGMGMGGMYGYNGYQMGPGGGSGGEGMQGGGRMDPSSQYGGGPGGMYGMMGAGQFQGMMGYG